MTDQCTAITTLAVGIPTYRRPEQIAAGLPLVLAEVRALNADTGANVAARIVVVDNDPEGGAEQVVTRLAAPEIRYVIEPSPGISAARNRLLDESTHDDLLVFIDDDERPRPGWLASLAATWRSTGAAAVVGAVVPQFNDEIDPWLDAGGFFRRRRLPTGTEIEVAATNNLLLDLRQVRALDVRFDPRFGLSGGEDTMFSRLLTHRGGRLVWCDESVAEDCVLPERLSRRWVLARAWSHGNSAGAVELAITDGPLARAGVRAELVLRGVLRIASGLARWLLGIGLRSKRHQAKGLRTAFRGGGMIAGAFGHVYQEYAR